MMSAMKVSSRHFTGLCLLLAGLAVVAAAPANAAELYQTDFESFVLGPVNGQEGWSLVEGNRAVIQGETVYGGSKALEIGAGSAVDKNLSGLTTAPWVWIDAWTRVAPQDPLPNPQDAGEGSSLVHFSGERGIVCLDGDGSGNGTWVDTGVSPGAGEWVRVTIGQNYAAKTWSCYVNETMYLTGLGFKDDLDLLSGFKSTAGDNGSAFLDDFAVNTLAPDFVLSGGWMSLFEFSTAWRETEPLSETAFYFDLDENSVIDDADLLILYSKIVN